MTEIQSTEASEAEMHQDAFTKLTAIRALLPKWGVEETDVRLCYDGEEDWHINYGLVDYDTHHGLACGASSIDITMGEVELIYVARDLVEQVLDQLAEQAP